MTSEEARELARAGRERIEAMRPVPLEEIQARAERARRSYLEAVETIRTEYEGQIAILQGQVANLSRLAGRLEAALAREMKARLRLALRLHGLGDGAADPRLRRAQLLAQLN